MRARQRRRPDGIALDPTESPCRSECLVPEGVTRAGVGTGDRAPITDRLGARRPPTRGPPHSPRRGCARRACRRSRTRGRPRSPGRPRRRPRGGPPDRIPGPHEAIGQDLHLGAEGRAWTASKAPSAEAGAQMPRARSRSRGGRVCAHFFRSGIWAVTASGALWVSEPQTVASRADPVVTSGVARAVGRRSGDGLAVEIERAAAPGQTRVRTLYAHLSSASRGLRPGIRGGSGPTDGRG